MAPCAGTYQFELWGAQGGQWSTSPYAGKGAYVKGQVTLAKSATVYIFVGGQGSIANASNRNVGGYNGGGYSHKNDGSPTCMAGGGGATDIRVVSGNWDNAASLRSRIMVAAGGGGGGYYGNGSNGCGTSVNAHMIGAPGAALSGGNSACSGSCTASWLAATSGTQISGGYQTNTSYSSLAEFTGIFGYAYQGYGNADWWGPGGGGGWYGGGQGGGTGGGGGSSYISGYTGAVAVTSQSSSSPKSGCTTGTTNTSCSISPYGYTFSSMSMIAGNASMPSPTSTTNETGHTGNGYARITLISVSN